MWIKPTVTNRSKAGPSSLSLTPIAMTDLPPSFTTKEEFEALILEGLDSPSKEMTKADWQKLRDDLVSKARTGSQYASQTH